MNGWLKPWFNRFGQGIFTRKKRDPAKTKRRRKIAKASRKKNQRKK